MLKNRLKNRKGFTVIEVLIVLAIIAVIILIVLRAVPALNRSSRNTERRQDALNYVAAVKEFMSNNNGKEPTTGANVATINSLANMKTLTNPDSSSAPATGAQTNSLALADAAKLVTKAKCDTAVVGNTVLGTSTRQFALMYTVEDSSGTAVAQCVDG